jgi:coproporphyrinogen III oxidase
VTLRQIPPIYVGRSPTVVMTRIDPRFFYMLSILATAAAWIPTNGASSNAPGRQCLSASSSSTAVSSETSLSSNEIFTDFVEFLKEKQNRIIVQLEAIEQSSGAHFTRDAWGMMDETNEDAQAGKLSSGGLTRVLQGGSVIEKGACSLTLIEQGILTPERAATIRSRQPENGMNIQAGDVYSAAALSMVLHTASPMVPTFRSDIRVFQVRSSSSTDDGNDPTSMAWFGGGADLTPYYLFDADIRDFHQIYKDLCEAHTDGIPGYSYTNMKAACDEYFYLPARNEHRGTGGIFFDDMTATRASQAFVEGVADAWMPSWLPIVERRSGASYTTEQKEWQLLRRGRYLEFNLLYDRGVKFGLANTNPRVEGVMVSAPPRIAYEYNHRIESGSAEDDLLKVLKKPKTWV